VTTAAPGAVTELLRAWSDGDEGALEQLVPLVEAELRRLARGYMGRERRGHTLQVTALVNEAFLRLTDARRLRWQDRAHFLGISARLMRRVLVDHASADTRNAGAVHSGSRWTRRSWCRRNRPWTWSQWRPPMFGRAG
jgi:RNA polymerase sigma factor (TIGR02999 family)